MKRDFEIAIPTIIVIAGALLMWAMFTGHPVVGPLLGPEAIYGPSLPQPQGSPPAQPSIPSPEAATRPPSIPLSIIQSSPEIFEYAHGTVMADGKIFIGMAARSGNTMSTNQLFVFTNLNNLKQFLIFSIPRTGDIESMVYDEKNDCIYFTLSNNGSLSIYRINPKTFFISTVISTTSVDIGLKPAITTDGKY